MDILAKDRISAWLELNPSCSVMFKWLQPIPRYVSAYQETNCYLKHRYEYFLFYCMSYKQGQCSWTIMYTVTEWFSNVRSVVQCNV
jgi:hypothetical protein